MPDLNVNVFRINRTSKKDPLMHFFAFFVTKKSLIGNDHPTMCVTPCNTIQPPLWVGHNTRPDHPNEAKDKVKHDQRVFNYNSGPLDFKYNIFDEI